MSDNLTFEEQKIQGYNRFGNDRTIPFFSRMVMKTGFVKSEKQAEKVLISIAILILVTSFSLIIILNQGPKVETLNIKSLNYEN